MPPSTDTPPAPTSRKESAGARVARPAVPPVWLWALAVSLLAAALSLVATHRFIQRQIELHPERFNTSPLPEKLLGLALQQQAFANAELLPVYGSSELTQPQSNRADDFFRSHPTGFGAFLIGNPGEACLMIAAKLAAADPATVRGRKAVVFLSPGWFVAPELDHPGFGVNFSPLQGGVLTFESRLSPALKQDLAQRLLDYPDIISKYPLLKAGLTCLAANTAAQRTLLAVLSPVAAVHNRVQRELDYARLGLWWLHEGTRVTPPLATKSDPLPGINWDARLRDAAASDKLAVLSPYSVATASKFDDHFLGLFIDPRRPERTADDNYNRLLATSKEWADYRLLLRTAQEMGVTLEVICQPLNANFSRLQQVGPASRAQFYERLRAETAPFPVQLVTYEKEGEDPHFFQDANHPTPLMWLLYDHTLDAFYHQSGK